MELCAEPEEVVAASFEAVQRCGEVVDRAAPPAAAEAVPAARGGLVYMQACVPVLVERARHLPMARDLDAEQPTHIDVRRDLQECIVATVRFRHVNGVAAQLWRVG